MGPQTVLAAEIGNTGRAAETGARQRDDAPSLVQDLRRAGDAVAIHKDTAPSLIATMLPCQPVFVQLLLFGYRFDKWVTCFAYRHSEKNVKRET
jgi:hypothetical protein